jgi:hypothetical protein
MFYITDDYKAFSYESLFRIVVLDSRHYTIVQRLYLRALINFFRLSKCMAMKFKLCTTNYMQFNDLIIPCLELNKYVIDDLTQIWLCLTPFLPLWLYDTKFAVTYLLIAVNLSTTPLPTGPPLGAHGMINLCMSPYLYIIICDETKMAF